MRSLPGNESQSVITLSSAGSQTKPDCYVYGMAGTCCASMFVVFLVGIFMSVPWLGLFGILAVVPGCAIMYAFYWRNYKHQASIGRVAKFMAIGMLTVLPIIIAELSIEEGYGRAEEDMKEHVPNVFDIFLTSFVEAFLMAALCEETSKYLVAYFVRVEPNLDSPYSVVIYSMANAVGLATLENLMYVLSVGASGNIERTAITAVLRAFIAVPLHASTGIMIGVDMARNKFEMGHKNYFEILAVPFVVHGVYDFCMMFSSSYYDQNGEMLVIIVLPLISLAMFAIGAFYALKKRKQLLPPDGYHGLAVA